MNNLAGCYRELGRDDEALELNRKADTVQQRTLEPDPMEAIVSRRMYGQWLIKMGRRKEGLAELHETYKRRAELLGVEHRDTRNTRGMLEREHMLVP